MTDRQTEVNKRKARMSQYKRDYPKTWASKVNEPRLLVLLDEALTTTSEYKYHLNLKTVDNVLNRLSMLNMDAEAVRKRQAEVDKRKVRIAKLKRELPHRWAREVNEDNLLGLLDRASATNSSTVYNTNLNAVDNVLRRLEAPEEPIDYEALSRRQAEVDKRKARISKLKRDQPMLWKYGTNEEYVVFNLERALTSDDDCEIWLGAVDMHLDNMEEIKAEHKLKTQGELLQEKKRRREELILDAERRARESLEYEERQRTNEAQKRANEIKRRAYEAQRRADVAQENKRKEEQRAKARKRKRYHIRQAIKNEVWERDGGACVRCGSTKNIQFDHDIPHADWGSDDAKNIQLLCASCNLKKGRGI